MSPGYRITLTLFLVLLIYDGAVRKWLLPEAEQFVFIVKDVIVLAAFCWAFVGQGIRGAATLAAPARICLAAYAFWVACQAANPRLPNLLVGLWGIKIHLLYVSLLVLIPLAFADLRSLLRALERSFAWVVIPVILLGFFQITQPASSWINQQVRGGLEGIAYFGDAGLVRVAGTFSYISGMAAFVQCAALSGLALFLAGARSRSFLFGLGLALMGLPLTGSRAVVVIVVVGSAMLLLAAMGGRLISGRYLALAGVVLVGLAAASLATQEVAWEALRQRAEGARYDENRAVTAFTNAFDFFAVAGPTGFGAGSTSLGAPVLATDVPAFSWLPPGIYFEEESGRLVLEMGIVGWAISLTMRIVFLGWAAQLAVRGATKMARLGGIFGLPTLALAVHQGNGVFAVPLAAAYYWFCVAVLAMAQHESARARNTARAAQDFGALRAAS